ncbi:RHS repeat domain-containing protein, partial [Waddlia chondrophila]
FEIDGIKYVPQHDLRGNVALLLSPAGKAEVYRYSAFGEELFQEPVSPWRFSSKRVDEETGWVYFGRRYYAPSWGRWTTA